MTCRDCKDKGPTLTERLNKRVTIWRPRTADDPPPDVDEYGQPIDEPIEVCKVWAAIEPLQGREYFAAFAEHADVTTRIRIRWRAGIDRTMTVTYGDQEWEILHSIHPQLAKKELQLMSKERQ